MRTAFLLMLFLCLLQATLSYATLDVSPANTDTSADTGVVTARLDGKPLDQGDAIYAVSQSKLPSGTIVRAYSDLQGKIFAISWNGPTQPDLDSMLGEHFDHSNGALPPAPLSIARPDMVIVSSGRPRAYNGKAWIPKALPAGFDANRME